MIKSFLLSLLVIACVYAQTGNYCGNSVYYNNAWCMSWVIANNPATNMSFITFTVIAKTPTGGQYIGFGLNNEPLMAGSHAIVGWVLPSNNATYVSTRVLSGNPHNAVPDALNYATPLPLASWNVGGVTTISYSRPLSIPNNVYGIPAIINAFTEGLWSIGPDYPSTLSGNLTMHDLNLKGTFAVNFFTGQTMAQYPSASATSDASSLSMISALLVCLMMLLF